MLPVQLSVMLPLCVCTVFASIVLRPLPHQCAALDICIWLICIFGMALSRNRVSLLSPQQLPTVCRVQRLRRCFLCFFFVLVHKWVHVWISGWCDWGGGLIRSSLISYGFTMWKGLRVCRECCAACKSPLRCVVLEHSRAQQIV